MNTLQNINNIVQKENDNYVFIIMKVNVMLILSKKFGYFYVLTGGKRSETRYFDKG